MTELDDAQDRNVRFAKDDLMQFTEDKRRAKFWGRCIRAYREGFTADMIKEHLVPIALEVGVTQHEADQAIVSAKKKYDEELKELGETADAKAGGSSGDDGVPF